MQKTMGNQAVLQLLRREKSPIQRELENQTYNDKTPVNVKLANSFFDSYNKAVKNAFNFVVSVPSLGAFSMLDGHTKKWVGDWQKVLDGEPASLLSASFGYVIETLVSHSSSPFRPGDPTGCTVLTQVVHGGTRPDLVLWKDDVEEEIAWLDITASNSADHIFDKDGWEDRVGIFAEVTYDSLTDGILMTMAKNRDNTTKLTSKELKEQIKREQEIYEHKKFVWHKIGEDFKFKALGKSIPESREEQRLDPTIRQNFIHHELESYFDCTINLKLVPSILAAMNVGEASWYFISGFSINERTGDAWLNKHVPSYFY